MSLSKRIRSFSERRNNNNTGEQWLQPLIPGRPAYMMPAGVEVTPETAIRMSTVYACVRLLGDTIASLPMGAYVRRGRNRISYAAVYGSIPEWVNKPNPDATRLEFLEQVISSLNIHGNAYILTVRDNIGEVIELYCLNPKRVRIHRPEPNAPIEYEVTVYDAGTMYVEKLTKNDVLHIPMFRLPGEHYGLGPIGAARTTLGVS